VCQTEVPAYQLALLITRNPDVAQEVVQEAFVRAWISPKTPRDPDGFRLWLYKIMVNLIHDERRRARRFSNNSVDADHEDPGNQPDRRIAYADLAQALGGLSRREREIVYLRFFEDAPYSSVARIYGAPEVAIRVILHRALRKLRKSLEHGGVPGGSSD